MKFRLSDPVSRALCVAGDLMLLAAAACLVLSGAARHALLLALCALLLVILGVYTCVVFVAALRIDPGKKTVLVVLPGRSGTYDVGRAVRVSTREVAHEQNVARAIVFSDACGVEVCVVPTFFAGRGGAKAEPLARAAAEALGLAFEPSVDPALYDRNARRIAREAARCEEKRLSARRKAKKGAPAPLEQEGARQPGDTEVNYDEMDDLK